MATDLALQSRAACLALALHNGEEIAGGLPGWLAGQPQLGWLARLHGPDWFTPAALALVLLAAAFALWVHLAPRHWMRYALLAMAIIMLANGLSHIALSLVVGSVMPGAVSAVLVLLPIFGWIAFSSLAKK